MIGTPFKTDDEQLQRKVNRINKKPWEQEVRDEKGRRRFHGAFTGGFSSGYFNTVGSKEGWNPTNYISSKETRDKLIKAEQTVMDFMDEEDIQEQVGSHRITSKEGYKDFIHQVIPQREKNKSIITGGEAIFADFLPQHNNAIGNKLMIVAGFDEMKRKSKSGDDSDTNYNKYYRGKLDFKDDYYGYGYVPGHDEMIQKSEKDILTNKNIISMDRFNDDYDSGYFNNNDLSEYNFEEVDDEMGNMNNKRSNAHNLKVQNVKFIKSTHKLQTTHQLNFELPKLPNDYDPFKYVSENKSDDNETKAYERIHQNMNPDRRSQFLNKETHAGEGNKYLNSKFLKADDKIKIKLDQKEKASNENNNQNNIKPPSSTDQIHSYFNFRIEIPFKDDLAKVSRFTKFIAEKEGLIIGDTYSLPMGTLTTASQLREERSLFEKLYNDEQKLKQAEEALKNEIRKQNKNQDEKKEEVNIKENSTVKREKVKWQPDKILCKRFKVKDPYENVVKISDDKFNKSLNEIQKEIYKEEARIHNYSNRHHHNPNNPDGNVKETNNEKNSFIIINAKPDLNLFEEIFGD